jgi:pyridoxamine 5'-phosphate oxidase
MRGQVSPPSSDGGGRCEVAEGEVPHRMNGVPEESLDERDLAGSWLEQFELWLVDASAAGLPEPNAMVLGTADERGRPSARTVLLKGSDARGLVFFTNLESRKGREIAANPWASLVFPWFAVRRQVVVVGAVSPIDRESSDEYFASRAYGSRIGAHASRQSSVISGRQVLERSREEAELRYPPDGEVPRPEGWGGFRVAPASVEFWQGRPDRLHDRLRYRREGERWVIERLSP